MSWEPMTVDEFAQYRREEGMKLAKTDGVWWAEVRPFFFRPLFPFVELKPWSRRYPTKCLLGGVLHLVPASVPARASINFHVYDDLPNYSLDILSAKRKKTTREALQRFFLRTIPDPDELVASGYQVYREFFRRTNYWYKNDRIRKENFAAWAGTLYDYPKIRKFGVYMDGRLRAVETSFRVGNVIFGDNLFSDDDSLRADVMDFLMHRLRELASETDARYLFTGLPTGLASLDCSKAKKGCKLLSLPAYCKINPLALSLAKALMKDDYRKLQSVIAPLPNSPGCE